MRTLCVTTIRDEGPYLLEWFAHHRAAGVTDFLVFTNDCSDGTLEILKTLQRAGIIRHIENAKTGNKSVQWQALKSAWDHPLKAKADWILVSDIDEFINIKTGDHTIQSLVDAISPEADGIMMQWRLFGHNNIAAFRDKPVTQQFTRAIPGETMFPVSASLCKTLFKPTGPFRGLGVHRPMQKPLAKARRPIYVDGSGRFLDQDIAMNEKRISLYGLTAGRDLVEMNHYAVKSAAAFLLKRARGLPNRKKPIDLAYWVDRNFNTVEENSIFKMRPATEAVLEEFMFLPGMRKLHEASVAWHQARAQDAIQTIEGQALFTKLLTAGGSAVLPVPLQRKLVRAYQMAQLAAAEAEHAPVAAQ